MVEQVRRIAENLARGDAVAPVTVREFLLWYDAERRGQNVVARIKADLIANGLETAPDFEGAWIDGTISFSHVAADAVDQAPVPDGADEQVDPQDAAPAGEIAIDRLEQRWVAHDPSYQISKLAAANQNVVSITPNATIERAVTVMLMNDYSQLPVMTGERTVQGIVSWKSVGRHLALRREGAEVRHSMEPAQEVPHYVSIFDVIAIVAQHDYVLVRDATNRIAGIVTATDLSQQFRNLSEPFLLLSEIENQVRNLIADRFTVPELTEVRDPADQREILGVADLTFGEYVRLLERPDNWGRLELGIDRAYFCERLEFVRKIRNDVMHFDPDGIQPDQLRGLREFARALRLLHGV